MKPGLMLFDEPTSGLDPEIKEEMLNVIKRLRTEEHMTMAPNVMTHGSAINLQTFRELTEFRLILEQGTARLVATNRTAEQSAALEDLAA